MSSSALARMPRAQAIDVLRTQIAPKATDDELAYFAQVCARLDLSPFADQIVLVGRWDSRVSRDVHRHQITVAGRRTLATRTGQLARIEGPEWCGPRAYKGAPLEWTELWDDDEGPPYAARCLVHRHDWTGPANGTAKWSEFRQVDGKDRLLRAWRIMPSHMLGKVAESMALRRAFPDTITPDAVDGFEAVAFAPDLDRVELEDATAGVDDALVVDELEVVRADAPPDGPRPLTPGDQTAAHRRVAELDVPARMAWLEAHGLDDFGAVWPADAVRSALDLEAPPC